MTPTPGSDPYLTLGVDYGANPASARRAFTRAQRRARRAAGSDASIADLNAALHAIEQREDDPFDDVTAFRVPADPDAFSAQGQGLLDGRPTPRGRLSGAAGEAAARYWGDAVAEVSALLDEVVPMVTGFEYGYEFEGDTPRG